MKSKVAEATRRRQAEREAAMSPAERLTILERANEFAIALYARAHGIDRDEAIRQLREAGTTGRVDSPCARQTTTR